LTVFLGNKGKELLLLISNPLSRQARHLLLHKGEQRDGCKIEKNNIIYIQKADIDFAYNLKKAAW